MKSQSQILMIALAISFAMALALTVALICISYIKETPPEYESDGWTLPIYPATESLALSTVIEPTTDEPPAPVLSNGLRFVSNGDGTCVLVGIGSCEDSCVVIPEFAPSGERVTDVAAMAFYGCGMVKAIQIPASVRYIGNLAFAACSELAYISVSPNNPDYCDVDGVLYTKGQRRLILYPPMRVGKVAVIDTFTAEIADMAFYGCAYLASIDYRGSAEQWESIRIGMKNYSLTAASKSFGGGNT